MTFIMSVFDEFAHYHKRWVLYGIGNSPKNLANKRTTATEGEENNIKAPQVDLS